MKKFWLFGIILTVIFAFALNVNAQRLTYTGGDDPVRTCVTCEKCDPIIECPEDVPGDQQTAGITGQCYPFDYDDHANPINQSDWTADQNGYLFHGDNCRLIFKVCNCPDSCETFSCTTDPATGATVCDEVGIRMTILTDGVYWSADWTGNPVTAIDFGMYRSYDLACNATLAQRNSATNTNVRHEGVSFESIDYLSAQNSITVLNYADLPTGTDCNIANASKSKILISTPDPAVPNGIYTLLPTDVSNQLAYWWIDVPPMRLDMDEITQAMRDNHDEVRVRVELLNQTAAGICPTCIASCSCEIVVGTLCQDEAITAGNGCMYFPYVLSQSVTDGEGWLTGIAIVNMQPAVDDPMATFTLTDCNGGEYTATMPIENCFSSSIDALIDELSWTPAGTPAPGQAWLMVESNFAMDGYQFNLSTIPGQEFGAGVLPRLCTPGCTPR